MYPKQMNIGNKRGSRGFINRLPNEILYRISDFAHYDEARKRASARKDAEEYIQSQLARGPDYVFPNQEQYIQGVVDNTMNMANYLENENLKATDVRRELNKMSGNFANNVRGL